MANRIVSVHAGIYGIGMYAIMLPSSGFSVVHYPHALIPAQLHVCYEKYQRDVCI